MIKTTLGIAYLLSLGNIQGCLVEEKHVYTHRDSKFGILPILASPNLSQAQQPISEENMGDTARLKGEDARAGKTSNFESRCVYTTCIWNREFEDVKEISKEAGRRILEMRNAKKLVSSDVVLPNGKKVRQTNADVEASQYIIEELTKKYPLDGLISQDQMDKDPLWHAKDRIWLINAIDGTKEFENGGEDFHIQIGLLDKDDAVIGVSYYPATDTYVWAIKGQGAWIEKNGTKQRLIASPSIEKILLTSSSHSVIEHHFEEWEWFPDRINEEPLSSTSRLLEIIQGKASLYISLGALGPEKKGGVWNYGANVVIANEAGIILTTLKGQPLNLREPSALLPAGILLTNDPVLYRTIVAADF